MFRGRFEHSVDDKGRIAIPSRFRDLILGEKDVGHLVITNFEKCLAVYSMEDWEVLEQRISQLPQFDPKVAAFKRIVVGCAQECEIDKAGRILIPADLRRDARIEKECVIVGQLGKFEIWSASIWQKVFDEATDQFNLISASIAEAGVKL